MPLVSQWHDVARAYHSRQSLQQGPLNGSTNHRQEAVKSLASIACHEAQRLPPG